MRNRDGSAYYQFEVGDIGLINSSDPVVTDSEIVPMAEFERDYIFKALKATNWKIRGTNRAATLLQLPPSTLYNKMQKLGIKRP